jgi:hypothetical protein
VRGEDRDLVYLLQLARKHNLTPCIFHDSLISAMRRGKARSGDLLIEIRSRGEDSSTYMFSVKGQQFSQAKIRNESVKMLKRLPDEFSSFFKVDERRSTSGALDPSKNVIGNMRFGLRDLSFKARVVKKSEVRAVTSKDGTPLLVCSVTLSDGTGEIPLAVWNGQISAISEGDLVQVQNARVRSYRGKIQLSLSRKTGDLIVLKSANREPGATPSGKIESARSA